MCDDDTEDDFFTKEKYKVLYANIKSLDDKDILIIKLKYRGNLSDKKIEKLRAYLRRQLEIGILWSLETLSKWWKAYRCWEIWEHKSHSKRGHLARRGILLEFGPLRIFWLFICVISHSVRHENLVDFARVVILCRYPPSLRP